MITKIELQRLAKQNGINTHIQEKDYLQYHILHSLYSKTEDIVFKGGTCLKIVYGFDRFSEDLDFATNTHVENIISLIKKVITDLDYVGISANIKNQRTLKRGFYAILQYKGPLFQGTPISQGKIQLDFSFRGDVLLNPVWIPIFPIYSDIPKFDIFAMQEQEILAEKIRALFTRSKARDLYDTWLLLKKGIKTNSEIIQQKLKVVKKPISEIKISEKEWHQDLDILLPHTPDFNRVHSEVISVLNTIDKFIKNLS